jgi:L-asparaginase
MTSRVRIAHLAGSNATIQNTPALVTSNKARAKHGLPLLHNKDGSPPRFDALRPQRLAAPATIYVEQFSAHPLEADAAELYGPPDGYIDAAGQFRRIPGAPEDKPVYEIELRPEDGLYPLPYMALQADGKPWDEEGAFARAPAEKSRQSFFPDGSRSFEEIDRLGIGKSGTGNLISSVAEVDFYRISPPGGYTKGLAEARRSDVGAGDIAPEQRGKDFFPYKPNHLRAVPPRQHLARMTNEVQRILATGKYDGAILTEGSPRIEESIYWLNLLIDTTVPICGNAAQRPQGYISNDGPKNIADSVEFIASKIWQDESGRNRIGAVLIQEQRIFAARDVMKVDARPGGYAVAGGHGGIIGGVGADGPPVLRYLPVMRHTHSSEVNVSRLPAEVRGVRRRDGKLEQTAVPIKAPDGSLLPTAIPKVAIVKDGSFAAEDMDAELEKHVDIAAWLDQMLHDMPLAGFVVEGMTPYGSMTSAARQRLLLKAAQCGLPVVVVGRGNTEGFAIGRNRFIGGSNLTATKARLLLMACLMKLGSLPPAADPDRPTAEEGAAIDRKIGEFQAIFDTH